MSASPDSEIAIDNPSSNETSQEIFTAMCNPSSEEISSISGATGFVTPPESLTGIGDFPSNEEIPSKPSLCMDRPISAVSSDVRQALGNDPSSVNTSSGVSTPSSAYNPDIPPEVSEEATDESGQEVFQTVLEATLSSPSSPNTFTKVNCFKRIWLQKDPWISHYKKYRCFFFVGHTIGIIGLILFGCRFASLMPDPYPIGFSIASCIVLITRCLFMHLLIPNGPPCKSTSTGIPIYKTKEAADPFVKD